MINPYESPKSDEEIGKPIILTLLKCVFAIIMLPPVLAFGIFIQVVGKIFQSPLICGELTIGSFCDEIKHYWRHMTS